MKKFLSYKFTHNFLRIFQNQTRNLYTTHTSLNNQSINQSSLNNNHKYRKLKLDYDYLCNPENTERIERLIHHRKNRGDIKKVIEISNRLRSVQADSAEHDKLRCELETEALTIPNKASPHLWEYGDDPKVLEYINPKPRHPFPAKEFSVLGQNLNVLRTENLGNITGTKSYYFLGGLANLEHALIRYTVSHLLKCGFTLMSVPDLLYGDIIEDCGMTTTSNNTQVYKIIDPPEGVYLSGTAEMAMGGYLRNRQLKLSDLPLKLAAVSRCYRSEVSGAFEERGIYRVHMFTKVEMFGVTANEIGDESHNLYMEMTQIQRDLFSKLGIHFQILDMPLNDLGAPAYTKTDMEAWMPGRAMYGEISSASNCTDYQACRLNITYTDHDGNEKLAHTVNGTACAVPRMIIALCETFQNYDGTISLPSPLYPYLPKNMTKITQAPVGRMSWINEKSYSGKIVE